MLLSDAAASSSKSARPLPKPYSGWALNLAIDLDCACPGLLAASFQFGATRRQTLFLVLAIVEEHGIDEIAGRLRLEGGPDLQDQAAPAILGRTILTLRRPRDLVRAVLGGAPNGLVGVLGRLGQDPISDSGVYLELTRLCGSSDPADRRRVKVLGQISGSLVGAQVAILSLLDPVLLHPAYVSTIYETRQVAEVHQALAYVRAHCTKATDEAIWASLGQVKPDGHRAQLIKAWAARFDRLPYTLNTRGDPTLIVLGSAAALADAGRRYSNCLGGKTDEVLLGGYLFVEYRPVPPGEPGAIAELRRTSQGYLLEGLYAANNRRLKPHRARLVREKLAACGVAIISHPPGDVESVMAAANLLGAHNLFDPDLDRWGVETLEVSDDPQGAFAEAA
jgi:hypothetical protein